MNSVRPNRRLHRLVLALALGLVGGAPLALATDVIKANNSDTMNLGTSWVGGVAPSATQTAVWNSTVTGANTIALTANMSISGIRIVNPGGNVTITNLGASASTIDLGPGGIDLSASTRNLSLTRMILNLTADQTWNIASSRIATFTSGNASPYGLLAGSGALTKSGDGVLFLSAFNSWTRTGNTILNGGTLVVFGNVNGASALGAGASSLTLSAGTLVLRLNSNGNFGRDTTVIGNVTIFASGSGGNPDSGSASYTFGDLAINDSTLTITSRLSGVTVGQVSTTTFSAVTLSGAAKFEVFDPDAEDTTMLTVGAIGETGGSRGFTKLGDGILRITGASTFSGAALVSNGLLRAGAVNVISNSSGLTVGPSGTFDVAGYAQSVRALTGEGRVTNTSGTAATLTISNSAVSSTFAGTMAGEVALTKAGSSILILSGANSFTGGTTVNGGTLKLDSANAFPGNALTVNAGIFDQNGYVIAVSALNGTGGVISNAGLAVSGGGSFAGTIAGAGALTHAGSVLTLSGNNTYTGPTVVNSGTLEIANTSGTGLGGSSVTVNGNLLVNNTGASVGIGSGNTVTVNSGGKLGGTGTIAGSVTVASGGSLSPGSSIGQLNVGTLTLSTGSRTDFEFLPSNDQIRVLNSGGLSIQSDARVNLYTNNSTVAFDTPGLYSLIQYSGAIGGVGASGLTINNPINNRVYTFAAGGGWITLTIGGTNAGWVGGGADADWNTPGNWVGGIVPVEFDGLLFDGNSRVNNTNNLPVNTQFTGIVFTNTAGSFVLSGNALRLVGSIANLSSNSQTIHLPLALHGGSRIVRAIAGNLTLAGVISDGGSGYGLTKQGNSNLVLTGLNTYSGETEIQAGVLRANHGQGLPTASNLKLAGGVLESIGAVTLTRRLGSNAGSLQWTGDGGFSAYNGKMTVNLGGAGAEVIWDQDSFVPSGNRLVFGSRNSNHEVEFVNPINLGNDVRTIEVLNNTGTTTDFATLKGGISNGSLTKTGAGKLVLAGHNSFTGALVVNAGTLVVNGSVAGGDGLTLNTGTTLGGTGFIARTVSGSGTVAPGNSPGILTVSQLDPSANMNFSFEFTAAAPNYSAPLASLNDVLRITNTAAPFLVDLGVTNTVNLFVSATLTPGMTNIFHGGFYTDANTPFDAAITGATFNVYLNNQLIGAPVFVTTTNEVGTQFGGQDGYVMAFGVYSNVLLAVPEPQVLMFWLCGGIVLWGARRRHRQPRPTARS